jgi:hypothetical protein
MTREESEMPECTSAKVKVVQRKRNSECAGEQEEDATND